MLTPKVPFDQLPLLPHTTNSFLNYKKYQSLCWKRRAAEFVLVFLVAMVAVGMGKAQSTTVLFPELAIGLYFLLIRGPWSLIPFALGEGLALWLHGIPILFILMLIISDLLFFALLYLSLNKFLDKIIAFQDLKFRCLLFGITMLCLIPWSYILEFFLPLHFNVTGAWFASNAAVLSLLPAALIWDRYIPQKGQFWGEPSFSLLMAIAFLTTALSWNVSPNAIFEPFLVLLFSTMCNIILAIIKIMQEHRTA